jgi:hypothetical protein
VVSSFADREIVCAAPAMTAGRYAVRVDVPTAGYAMHPRTVADHVSFMSTVRFDRVEPFVSSLTGGLVVTVHGHGFSDTKEQNRLSIGGRLAHIIHAEHGQIVAVTPPAPFEPAPCGFPEDCGSAQHFVQVVYNGGSEAPLGEGCGADTPSCATAGAGGVGMTSQPCNGTDDHQLFAMEQLGVANEKLQRGLTGVGVFRFRAGWDDQLCLQHPVGESSCQGEYTFEPCGAMDQPNQQWHLTEYAAGVYNLGGGGDGKAFDGYGYRGCRADNPIRHCNDDRNNAKRWEIRPTDVATGLTNPASNTVDGAVVLEIAADPQPDYQYGQTRPASFVQTGRGTLDSAAGCGAYGGEFELVFRQTVDDAWAATPGAPTVGGTNDGDATGLEACIGECDGDGQCAAGLVCFERDGYTPVPGCNGMGDNDWDYCTTPAAIEAAKVKAESGGGGYLSRDEWMSQNPDDPTADVFSVLDRLETYRGVDGAFEFLLAWPDEVGGSSAGSQQWRQTSNPTRSQNVEGYQDVAISHRTSAWGGLAQSTSSQALLDGSVGSNWYYAVGTSEPYKNGIPGPDDATVGACCPLAPPPALPPPPPLQTPPRSPAASSFASLSSSKPQSSPPSSSFPLLPPSSPLQPPFLLPPSFPPFSLLPLFSLQPLSSLLVRPPFSFLSPCPASSSFLSPCPASSSASLSACSSPPRAIPLLLRWNAPRAGRRDGGGAVRVQGGRRHHCQRAHGHRLYVQHHGRDGQRHHRDGRHCRVEL